MIDYRIRNNIKRTFENFLHQIGYDNINVVVGMREWCYDDTTQTIHVQPYDDEEIVDKTFLRVCKELGLKYECPLPILSFLHELGHYIDYNETFESSEADQALPMIWCMLYDIMKDEKDESAYYTYMMSFRERVATQWAVNFVNNNVVEIADLCERLFNAIEKLNF